jgi:hypothetical protein
MLPYPLMGALALAILWVNGLLVAAAALKELWPIRAWTRAIAGGARLVEGIVVRGNGPYGALAVHRVEQLGRATDAGGVVFSDRSYRGEVFGGAIALEGGGAEVAIAESAVAEVWLDATEVAEAAACPSPSAFVAALEPAKKACGHTRTVEAAVREGARVFVVVGRARESGPDVLVATIDPRSWARKRSSLVIAFAMAELLVLAGFTTLALAPPAFGAVSKVGALLGLAFFLLVTPLGTMVRDAVRPPSRCALRGRWSREGSVAIEAGAMLRRPQ